MKKTQEIKGKLAPITSVKANKIMKGIIYKNKNISDLCKEFGLIPARVRQLLWIGMRDMKSKSIKPFN